MKTNVKTPNFSAVNRLTHFVNRLTLQQNHKNSVFKTLKSTKTRLNHTGSYRQYHPIKYQPIQMSPDIFKLNSIDHTTIRTKTSFYIKNAKLIKQSKTIQTKSNNRNSTTLDYTTKSISTFVRENIGFYRFLSFQPKIRKL